MTEQQINEIRRLNSQAWVRAWPVALIDELSASFPDLRRAFQGRMQLALSVGRWHGKVCVWKDEMERMVGK